MIFYKLILNNQIVGVVSDSDLRRYQQKHNAVLACSIESAQFFEFNGNLYRAFWMNTPYPTIITPITMVETQEIQEEEYNQLLSAFDNGDAPMIETPQDENENEGNITLEFVKESKLNEMSRVCNEVITNGFDVVLSDGETHHFSLTVQDQLNLITLLAMVQNGETNIPYHADGELCRYFSVQDILAITNTATAFKTYHVTYYNSLKSYIESLETVEAISAVTYGIPLPEEYQSDILKELIAASL